MKFMRPSVGVCFCRALIKIYTVAQLETFYLVLFSGKAVWGIKECSAFSVFSEKAAAVILHQLPLVAKNIL